MNEWIKSCGCLSQIFRTMYIFGSALLHTCWDQCARKGCQLLYVPVLLEEFLYHVYRRKKAYVLLITLPYCLCPHTYNMHSGTEALHVLLPGFILALSDSRSKLLATAQSWEPGRVTRDCMAGWLLWFISRLSYGSACSWVLITVNHVCS